MIAPEPESTEFQDDRKKHPVGAYFQNCLASLERSNLLV